MREFLVETADAMTDIGADFARSAAAGDVFGLVGTLGTGKTHWTKGFVRALGGDAEVSSPTFSLVNEYPTEGPPVFHFDFYRLKSARELLALGWDEYLDQNAVLVCEWADRFTELMPAHTRWLRIEHLPDGGRRLVADPTQLPPPSNEFTI